MTPFTIARLVAAGMLFIAVGRHPYGYYQLMRLVVCVVAGYGAFAASERNEQGWAWTFSIMAFLFNPLIPVHLDRSTWAVIDVVAGGVYLASLSVRSLVYPAGTKTTQQSASDNRDTTESTERPLKQSLELDQHVPLDERREAERKIREQDDEQLRAWQARAYKR